MRPPMIPVPMKAIWFKVTSPDSCGDMEIDDFDALHPAYLTQLSDDGQMIAALQRPFRIDENVGDILCVTYLAVAFADLKQRIIGRAGGIGRIEQEHGPKPRTPTGGQLEILALYIVDDRGIWPRQEGLG